MERLKNNIPIYNGKIRSEFDSIWNGNLGVLLSNVTIASEELLLLKINNDSNNTQYILANYIKPVHNSIPDKLLFVPYQHNYVAKYLMENSFSTGDIEKKSYSNISIEGAKDAGSEL